MRRRLSRQILATLVAATAAAPGFAAELHVGSADELRGAIARAAAGDAILLAPGHFRISRTLTLDANGTEASPIVLRASEPLQARLEVESVQGLLLRGAHWRIEGLQFAGVCREDDKCEHAIHIVGGADGAVIAGNRMQDFNAAIKGNGRPTGDGTVFPNDVVIEGNQFFDSRPRRTANPVAQIDVVGGRRWVIRGNFFADFAKQGGNGTSYAAFLKGGSREGLFERNLVICEWRHRGGTRVGLSFGGGGGDNHAICEGGDCTVQHSHGLMRNNIVLNCPDVGIYVNSAEAVRVLHNTLLGTAGIDVRFPHSSAIVRHNLLDGSVRARDGAGLIDEHNEAAFSLASLLRRFGEYGRRAADSISEPLDLATLQKRREGVDAAMPDAGVTHDFCGSARGEQPDIGALEFPAACDPAKLLP